ncbi:polysaccharide biosynthesis protein [Trabulsiella odontotermitis]|uniref:polysaccharide biosynthesis protein n=1 Tax=Trabulsiella odontotermitis TaxID=379893 RepID=UPI0006761D5E|nr:polysaccharide biosynthesis protein [Trabulsiella odontotermitis]KNC91475.1 polysaccharide biosynthesis protein [Trabulsiella odontotermitis]
MFKKSLVYLVLNYAIQFINIALNLLFMRYLSSWHMGSLSLAKTWQQLVDYAHLGTRFSLDRYIPVTEDRERVIMVASVLIFTFLSACIIFIISSISSKGDITVVVLTLCGIGISLVNIIKCYYRACNRINEMLMLVFRCQFIPILAPLTIYLINHNWYSYLFSTLLCYTASILHLLYKERKLFSDISIAAVVDSLKSISSSSAWLFANSIFIFLYLVMDRFFIDYSAGRDILGKYSIITFAFSALMVIPSTCAELLFVKVVKQTCQSGKIFFLKESFIIVGITVAGVLCANLVMEYFIINFTSYEMLIPQIHLATFAVIPFAFTSIYYHVMNGLDLRKQMVYVSGCLFISLLIYYSILFFSNIKDNLNYYLYAKLATGWFIFMGYLLCILLNKRKSMNGEQTN